VYPWLQPEHIVIRLPGLLGAYIFRAFIPCRLPLVACAHPEALRLRTSRRTACQIGLRPQVPCAAPRSRLPASRISAPALTPTCSSRYVRFLGYPDYDLLTIFNWAACAHTIFFLRTHLQKHITAATAARAGAIVGARREEVTAGACAAAVYSKKCVSLLQISTFGSLFPDAG
jgi:hypothetical protein